MLFKPKLDLVEKTRPEKNVHRKKKLHIATRKKKNTWPWKRKSGSRKKNFTFEKTYCDNFFFVPGKKYIFTHWLSHSLDLEPNNTKHKGAPRKKNLPLIWHRFQRWLFLHFYCTFLLAPFLLLKIFLSFLVLLYHLGYDKLSPWASLQEYV